MWLAETTNESTKECYQLFFLRTLLFLALGPVSTSVDSVGGFLLLVAALALVKVVGAGRGEGVRPSSS